MHNSKTVDSRYCSSNSGSFCASENKRAYLGSEKEDRKVEIPQMIENKSNSFKKFLNLDVSREAEQSDEGILDSDGTKLANACGLRSVFESIFPIEDSAGRARLEFLDYFLEPISYDPMECVDRDLTYFVRLRISVRLIVWSLNSKSAFESDCVEGDDEHCENDKEKRTVKSIKEQSVYLCNMPMMTESGTFVINGAEHVIVSQMHRSPGVFFDSNSNKETSSTKPSCSARIIPYRGSWLDFEFDSRDFIHFRIDRKRKMYISTLFFALGFTSEEILSSFYNFLTICKDSSNKDDNNSWFAKFDYDSLIGVRFDFDLIDLESGKILAKSGAKLTKPVLNYLKSAGLKKIAIPNDRLCKFYSAKNVFVEDGDDSIKVLSAGELVGSENLSKLSALSIDEFEVLLIDGDRYNPYIVDTLAIDKNKSQDLALSDIYRVVRSGGSVSVDSIKNILDCLFFDSHRYDLSEVGRIKINRRLNLKTDISTSVLTIEDIVAVAKELIMVKDGLSSSDDIDHLGNRRVKPLNELIENQFRMGLLKVAKYAIERMSLIDLDNAMPYDLINPRLLSSIIKEFFSTSQLSQFMDQTNPLSEITHKRRVSALGPGGLQRERAGFEVRDVHHTHYGRICPIETPEGQNIGLINSLSIYAKVNKHGFIETPYRVVNDGVVTDEIVYLSADDEIDKNIASFGIEVDNNGRILQESVICRRSEDFVSVDPKEVDFVDVSPKQIISVAASLIPFLENNDANRALMGSNMQRQAVPIVKPSSPVVGTGMEGRVAVDSGSAILSKRSGVVKYVDSKRIVISSVDDNSDLKIDIYRLHKWRRTNFNTCINHIPLVNKGSLIKAGQIISDGAATQNGELALGNNVLVAFMVWRGNNFEDSVVISNRLVCDDVFTSVHIEEFECVARDTRLGPEEITSDIPNISEEMISHLDENGIVRIGARVRPGDIIVGKVTPKNEVPVTPEEKLLRAIFGEHSVNVKDSSLRVSVGVEGVVVNVQILFRKGVDKGSRALEISRAVTNEFYVEKDCRISIVKEFAVRSIKSLLIGQRIISCSSNKSLEKVVVDDNNISIIKDENLFNIVVKDDVVNNKIKHYVDYYRSSVELIEKEVQNKLDVLFSGVELQNGVLRIVKVFIASKHKLQPGDKVSGRHGNKGVVSKIVPVEDMPYLEDGTPIDVVLNPLGVPSRMNVGQILETQLGLACFEAQRALSRILKEGNEHWREDAEKLIFCFYRTESMNKAIKSMSDDDFKFFVEKILIDGLKISTPAFDSVSKSVINEIFDTIGADKSGQVKLFDGYTGEAFARKVTVGYFYMLKLHHLVDNKIHARSTGPYSLITQQPLGGKAQFGGQRLGEMEVWALEAYGAAYTLREMLTVKSDDIKGRVQVYESIIRGENRFSFGVPESFNVMVKELQGLCLRICFE